MKANKCHWSVILSFLLGVMAGVASMFRCYRMKQVENKPDHLYRNLNMVNQWLILKMKGMDIATGLKKQGISHVAIYGMGVYGRHLVRELSQTEIAIDYGIDQKKMEPFMEVNVVKAKSDLPEVDLVINSVIYAHDEISQELKQLFKCPVVSLEDLVFGSYQKEEG